MTKLTENAFDYGIRTKFKRNEDKSISIFTEDGTIVVSKELYKLYCSNEPFFENRDRLSDVEQAIVDSMMSHDYGKLMRDEINYNKLSSEEKYKFQKCYKWFYGIDFPVPEGRHWNSQNGNYSYELEDQDELWYGFD